MEFPRLEELMTKFPREKFEVLAIDVSNRKKKTLKMVEKTGVSFHVLLDNSSVSRGLYKIRGTPTTYVINREGLIVFRHVGYYAEMDELMEREIRALTAGPV